jgi:hypothetical protein
MTHFRIVGLMAVMSMAASADSTWAQPPTQPPLRTPTTSPYLNLLRGGSPGVTYYNLVRPQFEVNSALNQLQQQVGLNRQGLSTLEQSANRAASGLPPTGFVPQFQNQGAYFMTYGGGMMGGSQIPNRGSGGGLPRAMGVPALGAPTTGGIGSLGATGLGRMGAGYGRGRIR